MTKRFPVRAVIVDSLIFPLLMMSASSEVNSKSGVIVFCASINTCSMFRHCWHWRGWRGGRVSFRSDEPQRKFPGVTQAAGHLTETRYAHRVQWQWPSKHRICIYWGAEDKNISLRIIFEEADTMSSETSRTWEPFYHLWTTVVRAYFQLSGKMLSTIVNALSVFYQWTNCLLLFL